MAIAKDRADQFRKVPGLIQKYYVKLGQHNHYGSIYVWDYAESLNAYRESDLAAGISAAYKVVGAPEIEILEMGFQLRE